MTVRAIARKEFREVRRSKTVWGFTAVVLLVLAIPLLTQSGTTPRTDMTSIEAVLLTIPTLGTFVLPLAALVMSYNAIAGELESGSATYLLGLPNTRLEAIVGKLFGRTAAASLGIIVAFGIGIILVVVRFKNFPTITYLVLLLLTLYFVTAWTSIGVGISALVGSRGQALAGSLGFYFVFVIGFFIPKINPRKIAAYFVESVLGLGPMPEVYEFVFRLSPAMAYAFAGTGFIAESDKALPFFLQWLRLATLPYSS